MEPTACPEGPKAPPQAATPVEGGAAAEERPRKRTRSQSPPKAHSDPTGAEEVAEEVAEGLQHDPEYYFEDGSTVILVENILFKVHKTILARDSSTFETMFQLPTREDAQAEGGRDTNPIVLHGDTPAQFRCLLWALYAMPHEIEQASSTNSRGDWPDFDRFCDLTLMAHKYCFPHLEGWALGAFLHWLTPFARHAPPRIHAAAAMALLCTCAARGLLQRLRRVLELAVLCDDAVLHNAVVERLQSELCGVDADLPWFIALAERFAVAPLLGAAYYALMVKGRARWLALAAEERLTRAQLARLHNGYYALVSQWEAYRAAPPAIQQCVHYGHCCKQRWQAYWKELTKDDVIMDKFPADVLGRLDTVVSRIFAYPGIMDMHQECRSRALGAVRSLIKETKDGLASHFVDLP